MTDQTTYARAILEYDEQHEQALMKVITEAIFKASMVSDANVAAIRTGECAQALLTVLASILAMSPLAVRSPAAIRKTVDDLGKQLRNKVACAEKNEALQEFVRHSFRGNDSGGTA